MARAAKVPKVSWVTVAVGEKAHAIRSEPFWKKTLCGYWIRKWFVAQANDSNPRCRKCERSIEAIERGELIVKEEE